MTTKRASGHRFGWAGYASVLRGLQQMPATADEVGDRHGLHPNTSRGVMRALHAMKLIHVASWRVIARGLRTPVYGFGTRQDVPHPTGKPRKSDRSKNLSQTAISLASVMRALVRPVTIARLVEVSGCDDSWIGKFLQHCKQIGLVRIGAWRIGEKGGWPAALWVLGEGSDMPRPRPKARRLIEKESQARRKKRADQQRLNVVLVQQLHHTATMAPFGGCEA